MDVFNLHGSDWDRENERPGFRSRAVRVGDRIGAGLIGGSLYELDPGERTWPFHFHHANEEWLLVVRGRPSLRASDGERELTEGDVVCFPRGPDGVHQVVNRSDSPVRVLVLATTIAPEIVEYPDSDKVGIRAPSSSYNLRREPRLEYWEGE